MLLGVQTAEECMLKHIAQRGILGSMAEEALFRPLLLLYTSDGELSEEDLVKYLSLVRPYQYEPLARKIPRKMKTNSMHMGSLRKSCRADTKEP